MAPTINITDSSPSTRILMWRIWNYLSSRRRTQFYILIIVMILSSIAELVSLWAVLPFLAALSDPAVLWKQSFVQVLAIHVGFTSPNDLLLPASFLFAFSAVIAALIRLSNLWLNGRFAAAVGSDLSCKAYRRTLYQPYEVHLRTNSASIINSITSHINSTVVALGYILQVITGVAVAFGLLVGLLCIDAPVAIATAFLFGIVYIALALTAKRELRLNSFKIATATTYQLKALQEGLGAIRDVLLDGSQPTYLQIYRDADRPQRQLQAKNIFQSSFPRYVLEALGMVSIALLGGALVFQRGNATEIIPLLGALALGAQRLLPASQQIYNGWAALKSHVAPMQKVLAMLDQPLDIQFNNVNPLPLLKTIHLNNVNFTYHSKNLNVLNQLNLEIQIGERLGIIGSTGSGKSTTVDLLMGLLKPTSGELLVDGNNIHDPGRPELVSAWRSSIAHVPQNIYLADSSIAENIAFGLPLNQIDMDRVKEAASQAQIASFIESEDNGYNRFVGERGIRLSGGQRQRIGIARALYKKAQILVLDEATSALDTETEQAFMDSVSQLSKDLTIIMIAHRLSTVQKCDRVIRLDNGHIIANGPPNKVLY